jgi:hypothetical protein
MTMVSLMLFFSIFSHCFKSCDWPKEDLSKSGYKTNKEVENLGIFIKYWQTTKTYSLNMAISEEES